MKALFYSCLLLLASPLPAFMSSSPTPVVKFLTPIELASEHSGINYIDSIYVINLDERPERWNNLIENFAKYSVFPNRVSAINGWKIPLEQRNEFVDPNSTYSNTGILGLNGGEIGCLLSHISIYQDALAREFDIIWICEDDLTLLDNVSRISSLLQELTDIDPDWDILYTDHVVFGTRSRLPRPGQSHYENIDTPVSPRLQRTHGRQGTHSMIFSKKGLEKVYNYFSHVYLWTPIDLDIHFVPDLREYSLKQPIARLAGFRSDTQPRSPLSKNSP